MRDNPPISSRHLMYQIGSFKPSDRRAIRQAMSSAEGQTVFIEALMEFLAVWEKSDWLEDYNVERVAIWLSINAPVSLRANISRRIESVIKSGKAEGMGAFKCFLKTFSERETINSGGSASSIGIG